jgi:hypothetical protein
MIKPILRLRIWEIYVSARRPAIFLSFFLVNSPVVPRSLHCIFFSIHFLLIIISFHIRLLLWLYSPLLGIGGFSVSWSYTQSVGLLGREISESQGLYLYTEKHKHRINAYNKDIHALNGIRTHDLSVRASEDSSCLRPRGHVIDII